MTTLIVACCNGNPGLLVVDTDTHKVNFINDMDVRGVVWDSDDIWFLGRAGLYHKRPMQNAKLVNDLAADWHGLLHHDNRLWGVDPVSDTIVEFDMTGKFIARWHWKPAEEAGARYHTNDIQIDPSGKLWQCCFHRGICCEGEPKGWGVHRTPHSLLFHDHRDPYWCASNMGQVWHGDAQFAEWPLAFTRGLAALDDGIVVGLSANRNGAGGQNAQLKLVTWEGAERTIDLPTNEVYAIARVRGT